MRPQYWTMTGLAALALLLSTSGSAAPTSFRVSFPRSVQAAPITGRLIVLTATKGEPQPRLRIHPVKGPPIFGIDVEAVAPETAMTIDAASAAYPVADLSQLPAGDYYVQALLIRYTQVHRADGHTIWVPIPSGQHHATVEPGNLYSAIKQVHLDPAHGFAVELSLSEVIAPRPQETDTQWLKTVRIKSKVLSEFWGVPMYIGARVLLPRGFAEHPNSRYPGLYVFGHGTPFFFNPDPASHATELPEARDANLQTGYEFSQVWRSDGFPRVVGITSIVPSPYFLESYSVNSANNGPWGDAITQELIPYLERKFRLIAQPYARIVEGASTGGWEALALQLYYPDFFGGAWVFNPDPIDFHRYQLSDIYEDENMFSIRVGPWLSAERPDRRTREGQPLYSVRRTAQFEAVLGSKGRSNYQLDIWQATHGPVGPDGYPVPLFDKKTGVIDRDVVEYMRGHGYDLTEYTRRNWSRLGPKLAGKLNFFAGEQDDFFLNLGVYNYQEMLQEMRDPPASARFEYGRPKKGHNWHHTHWAGVVREMTEHIKRTAPAAADTAQWSY